MFRDSRADEVRLAFAWLVRKPSPEGPTSDGRYRPLAYFPSHSVLAGVNRRWKDPLDRRRIHYTRAPLMFVCTRCQERSTWWVSCIDSLKILRDLFPFSVEIVNQLLITQIVRILWYYSKIIQFYRMARSVLSISSKLSDTVTDKKI